MKQKAEKVVILMSSYNGEKYIGQQLDSIFEQDYPNIEVLVRDDGSTDKTTEILKIYEQQHDNLHVIYGNNTGVIESFFSLLSHADSTAAYYAFSDQDDIWLKDKISAAVEAINREDENLPVLYATEVQPIDEEGHLLKKAVLSNYVKPCFSNALVENVCVGCTTVMNHSAYQLLKDKKPSFTIMHDFWCYLVVSCLGKVLYDSTPHIHYRQHQGNVLGVSTSMLGLMQKRIQNFKKHRNTLYRQAKEFKKLYTPDGENGILLEEFIQSEKKLGKRLRIVRGKRIFRQNKGDNLIFQILLITGIL